jgi:homocysteine S-methyltransferase
MARNPIAEFLAQRPVIILDGALATELERRGADLHGPLWSAKLLMEQPSLIRAVHRDYFEAGADVAITASYQATFEAFGRRGVDPTQAAQLMRESVALAISARDEFWSDAHNRADRLPPLIAASVGSYGAMLADGSEYHGDYGLSDAQLMDFHRARLHVLTDSGADLLACETIPSLREAMVLARLLQEHPDASAWVSFACRDAEHTCEGQGIAECVAKLDEFAQIVAIGVNCTRPEYVGPLLRRMRSHTDKPLVAYPNSGERYDADARRWLAHADAKPFAELALDWYAAGARLIGGCCRTTPADIHRLREGLLQCA